MLRWLKKRVPLRYKIMFLDFYRVLSGKRAHVDANQVAREERSRKMETVHTLDAVRSAALELGFTYFLDYDKQIPTKRREFFSAVRYFELALDNRVVLDIGPGTADSLDCARELGALATLFVEEEPVFVRFAELKGHRGVRRNYTFSPYFPAEWSGQIDFVYSKGSINCEWVNEQEAKRENNDASGYFDFDDWITGLLQLLKPSVGDVVLVPAMPRQSENIVDPSYDLDTFYWCADLTKFRESFFCRTLVRRGFRIIENIPGFTQGKAFPLAFSFSKRDVENK